MKTMIAKFMLPDFTNDGFPTTDQKNRVLDSLLALAGGYSTHRMFGAFQMADGSVSYDASTCVHIALAEENLDKLISILEKFKEDAEQESVYLQTTDSAAVHFI